MEKAKFYIAEGPRYDGYTDGSLWNGWECPWFTKEAADQIAREVNDGYSSMTYNKVNDCFIYKEYGDEEPNFFKGEDIQGKHLYPVGAYSWIWDKADEKEEDK